MKTPEPQRQLYTASEVARICDVELKTIHNWADREEIQHFRTPGRHLRFRRAHVVEFLRKFGYPVPDSLLAATPRVHVIDDDAAALGNVRRGLSKQFEVTTFQDPYDALVAIGVDTPDAIVLELAVPAFDGLHCLRRLKQLAATRHIPIVVFSAAQGLKKKALEAGASAFVAKPDVGALSAALDALLGVESGSDHHR